MNFFIFFSPPKRPIFSKSYEFSAVGIFGASVLDGLGHPIKFIQAFFYASFGYLARDFYIVFVWYGTEFCPVCLVVQIHAFSFCSLCIKENSIAL